MYMGRVNNSNKTLYMLICIVNTNNTVFKSMETLKFTLGAALYLSTTIEMQQNKQKLYLKIDLLKKFRSITHSCRMHDPLPHAITHMPIWRVMISNGKGISKCLWSTLVQSCFLLSKQVNPIYRVDGLYFVHVLSLFVFAESVEWRRSRSFTNSLTWNFWASFFLLCIHNIYQDVPRLIDIVICTHVDSVVHYTNIIPHCVAIADCTHVAGPLHPPSRT